MEFISPYLTFHKVCGLIISSHFLKRKVVPIMAKVTTYSNSKFASFLSIVGYILIVGGVYLLFNDEVAIGIGFLVAGVVFKILGGLVSAMKAKKAQKKAQ